MAGYLLDKGLKFLKGAVDAPDTPLSAAVTGANASTKLMGIESLIVKYDTILLGGGGGGGGIFTFYKALVYDIGKSLVEDDVFGLAGNTTKRASEKGVKMILPADVFLADKFDNDATIAMEKAENISGD